MTQTFDSAMQAFAPRLPLAVAFSGGADSTALLLACAERWPGQVQAFHVHHGLQAAADEFERHCVALCARLNVPLSVQRVDARHAPGQSPEDAARQARYKAFEALTLANKVQSAHFSIIFTQCWAQYEAALKCLGLGLAEYTPALAAQLAHVQTVRLALPAWAPGGLVAALAWRPITTP